MKVMAIIKRILHQFRRDKRSMALMIVAPLFILTLMWLVLDGDSYSPDIAVVDIPEPIIEILEGQEAEIHVMAMEEAEKALKDEELDAMLTWDEAGFKVLLEGSDPNANSAVQKVLQQTMKESSDKPVPQTKVEFLHGSENLNLFDNVGPVLIGFFVFFFVFIVGGVSFLRERTQGTLERLLATPLKRWEIVTGYLGGFGVFTVIQSIIIAAFSIYVLNIYMTGEFWYVMLITFLLAMAALSLGTLLSAYANNEFQMMQFIPLVIVPQVFFSGIFNLDTMQPWLRAIGKVMPLTYGGEALRDIMIRGEGIHGFLDEVYILIGFSVLFILLNILALKRHRKL
ncbi:transport permease protein [Thalassobacillus devorans]|uniref:Transport permease protein n=1 Tax=Thalassobacillus devorans TaxID=279813 RepID=A0ABQ1PVX6_9BACI|nr:ABC transporter permease [Thalassobacillus devorans]NIK30847.1 ABC-2 type transport system permease protein [Thalassobacillus devorans]GGD04740.1 transport permease protein [Thalassobacillus devorans]